MATSSRKRRLTILDLMVLVAATAFVMMLPRSFDFNLIPKLIGGENRLEWFWTGPPTVYATVLAMTLLLLRLIPPRPRWRRLFRQPGFVAIVVSLAVMPLGFGFFRFIVEFQRSDQGGYSIYSYWFNTIGPIPSAVAGAWLALWLGGRWRAERSWVDRAGRVLGVFWIASIPAIMIRPAIRAFINGF